jgi:predicted anti-sigma-YlaC factor YlaD
MLTCREVSLSASDYLERNMPLRRRVSVRLHLVMCKHCRALVDQLAVCVRSLRSLQNKEPEPISDETRDQLLKLFRENRNDLEID